MMRAVGILLLASAAAATPAFAALTPRPGATDPRVRTVEYDPGQVYRIVGTFRAATEVAFGDDETIVNVAAGDTLSWEIVPRGHLLFVKPREHGAASNLIVTTARSGTLRDYAFELVARAGPIGVAARDTVFRIQFRYPQDERLERARLATLQAALNLARLEKEAVAAALDQGVLQGVRNTHYTLQGASDLEPSEVSDNGQFTALRFPANREVPSIYLVRPDNSETLVPFDVRGEFVVAHLVATELRLRRNGEVLCIYNEAVAPYGTRTGTDTASPYVERTMTEPPK